MAEVKLLGPELLQARSDTIIKGVNTAFSHGLNKAAIRQLQVENPTQHRNMFEVYLGLKSIFIDLSTPDVSQPSVFKTYCDPYGSDFLQYFPKAKDTGVPILYDRGVGEIWNPDMVGEILSENLSLLGKHHLDPNDPVGFANFLLYTDTLTATHKHKVLQGVLFGYPKEMLKHSLRDAQPEAARRTFETLRDLADWEDKSIKKQYEESGLDGKLERLLAP